jgi:hypothetical protein
VLQTSVAHSTVHSVVLIALVLTDTRIAQLPSIVLVMHPCGALLVVVCPQVKCAQTNSKPFAQLTGLTALVVFVLWHPVNAPPRLLVKDPRSVAVMVLVEHRVLVSLERTFARVLMVWLSVPIMKLDILVLSITPLAREHQHVHQSVLSVAQTALAVL